MMSSAFAGLIMLGLLCGPAFIVNAQDYFVATNGNDSAAGTSWAVPLLTISNAIAKASAGQVVAVSNGTYVLTTELLLNKGITLMGVGGASNTVIDANATNRVMTISNASAVLDGFTLMGGKKNVNGGGVSMSAGQVRNCIVSNNMTTANPPYGGGVYMTGGVLRDSTVANNRADPYYSDGRGGGVYVSGGAIVTNCLITGNVIDNTTDLEWARGGGLYISIGTVVDCTITNNMVSKRWRNSSYGGGVYLDHASAMLDRCIVTGNQVSMLGGTDSGRLGGGVTIRSGTARNCLIAGNQARNQAGGVWMDGGTLESCTIVRNAAVTADYGGVFRGGGTVLNCIIWNNTSVGVAPNITNDTSVTYSCSPSLTSGTGNIPADPFFVDSGSGGGLTFTLGDYRPVIGSPCEKTGFVSSWMSTALDLAGLSRLNGAQADVGCYLVAVSPKSTFVSESGTDSNDGTSWATAFKTIQKGIDAATALGTVSVNNGTYVLTTQLLLGKACTLVGVNGSANTIIDANASGRIMTIDNAIAVVEGFTLKNGKSATTSFNGTGVNMSGGILRNCVISGCTNTYRYAKGIGVYMATGTVDTCVIENNDGYGSLGGYGGGGIYMVTGIISNTLLRGNRSQNFGGAIRMEGGLVTDCVVTNNTVSTGVGGGLDGWAYGGGIYMTAGLVRNCTLMKNINYPYSGGWSFGGGVYLIGSGCVVSNCVLTGNYLSYGTHNSPNSQGGGAYVAGGVLFDSQITNNIAQAGWGSAKGGGVFVTAGGVVSNCMIAANSATCNDAKTRGGGVYIDWGTVCDCVVSNNSGTGYSPANCTYGGGVYMTGTSLVERCVITKNYQNNGWTSPATARVLQVTEA